MGKEILIANQISDRKGNFTADIHVDDTKTGKAEWLKLIVSLTDGVQTRRIKNGSKDIIAEARSEKGRPLAADEVHDWARSEIWK